MLCPYCKKDIYGMTGLQELQAFQKHLRKCRKYREAPRSDGGVEPNKPTDLKTALDIRAESGQ